MNGSESCTVITEIDRKPEIFQIRFIKKNNGSQKVCTQLTKMRRTKFPLNNHENYIKEIRTVIGGLRVNRSVFQLLGTNFKKINPKVVQGRNQWLKLNIYIDPGSLSLGIASINSDLFCIRRQLQA